MNIEVITISFIVTIILFLISLQKLNKVENKIIKLDKQIHSLNNRVNDLEMDEILKRLFQTDMQIVDLYLKKQMEAVADEKIQEHVKRLKDHIRSL